MNERLGTIKKAIEEKQPLPVHTFNALALSGLAIGIAAEERMQKIKSQASGTPSKRRQGEYFAFESMLKLINGNLDEAEKAIEAANKAKMASEKVKLTEEAKKLAAEELANAPLPADLASQDPDQEKGADDA